jgi:DNA modification methylase
MTEKLKEYNDFLLSKVCIAPETGLKIEIKQAEFLDGTILKPHQKDAIEWAIRGGRRALFESFGLGKTIQQLIICSEILKVEGGKALIVCPLGVRQEFFKDAKRKLGIELQYVKTHGECESAPEGSILITNYERVRDGNINPKYFTVTSLDEASVLRSYGSKTYQTFLDKFKGVKFKFVCTATPSPNKYKELIHYAGYLEIMDTGQALTRFFKRDSTQANNLTIYPHKEKEFWLWMSTWALFITKPSDLGYDNDGYDLPEMQVIYHKVKVDHKTAGADQDGQIKMFREAALGLKDAAKEKRESLEHRVQKMSEIINSDPESSYIIWHDLENERHAIKNALPECKEVYGTQDMDIREQTIIDFADGKIQYLATKPEISGQGCNFQYYCHKAIFLGIGYEFNSFIQAIHRIYRFQQTKPVEIHIIYAESEGEILRALEKKWQQHNYLVDEMTKIIKENGLSNIHTMEKLKRSIISDSYKETGKLFNAINGDAVPETMAMDENSKDLIVTSIPFSNHYEYTPTYNDFGHTSDNDHFFEQMDFLTPELYRILKPGRVAAIHVKDRILFGNATGDGMPTLDPFSDFTVMHFLKHGFRYFGRITIETDVVRENNQTYRLGWTEQCKDGSKMGVGCPEYVLLFRKLPSDTSKAYADLPVTKTKEQYTRGQWQIDARAKWNSSGERFLTPDEIRQLPIDKVNKYYNDFMKDRIYDYENHVNTAKEMDNIGKLPATFQTLNIPARNFFVWDDINRMLTLNGSQSNKKLQMHICPLQFDIVDRLINRFSNPGDLVFDPFGGLMTTPYRAIKLGRKGEATELNPESYKDGLQYLRAAEINALSPSLFTVFDDELKK